MDQLELPQLPDETLEPNREEKGGQSRHSSDDESDIDSLPEDDNFSEESPYDSTASPEETSTRAAIKYSKQQQMEEEKQYFEMELRQRKLYEDYEEEEENDPIMSDHSSPNLNIEQFPTAVQSPTSLQMTEDDVGASDKIETAPSPSSEKQPSPQFNDAPSDWSTPSSETERIIDEELGKISFPITHLALKKHWYKKHMYHPTKQQSFIKLP